MADEWESPSFFYKVIDSLGNNHLFEFIYTKYIKKLELSGNENILDFGSGSGAGSKHLARLIQDKKGSLTCIDTSVYWTSVAKKRLCKYKNVVFYNDSITKLHLPEDSFETYAVCLKKDNKAIGSIGLLIGEKSNIDIPSDEAEIGYWIGVPFWGQGLIPEAVRELMRYAFEDLQIKKLWCGFFDGNLKSKRVQEKCGFQYQYTVKDNPSAQFKKIVMMQLSRADIKHR